MTIIVKSICEKIAILPRKKMDNKEQEFVQHYLGTQKKVLGVKIADVLNIAKEVMVDQENIETKELVDLLDQLFAGDTFEEHAIGGKIFTLLKPKNRAKISFDQLEKWLAQARGWVEIDVICQSSFSGKEVLDRWPEWEKMIKRFRETENISLRRASLVLQTRSVKETNSKEMRRLAFETIEILKSEKDVLITKAISWLLRNLTVQDSEEVKKYLVENESTLPRIAYRETMRKIETGRKSGKC